MPIENPSEPIPMPARLVERALDLARAEVGLALVHTRRIAVRAVSALLGTIVACAFAQLSIVLVVAWPVIVNHVPLPNLLAGLGISVALTLAGGISAFLVWTGAHDKKPSTSAQFSGTQGNPPALAPAQRASSAPPGALDVELAARTSSPPGAAAGTGVRNVVVSRQRRSDTREDPPATTLAERVGS